MVSWYEIMNLMLAGTSDGSSACAYNYNAKC